MTEQTQNEQAQTKQDQTEQVRTEEFEINGDELAAKVKELIHEGNVRRISLQTQEGKTLLEVPLTVGLVGLVAGTLLAPVLAAIGALAAIVVKMKVKVERVQTE